MSESDLFSKEYLPTTKTESSTEITHEDDCQKQSLDIEVEKYGISKPKRVFIKALIINDKS
jgi:hypothetical protein